MSNSFNPYQAWLGFNETVSRPNYFELLGLDESEEDAKAISAAADRAASRVRRCRPGDRTAVWAMLLDQIADAKVCLIDPAKRVEYRQSLRDGLRCERTSVETTPNRTARSESVRERVAADPNMFPPAVPRTMPGPATSPLADAPAMLIGEMADSFAPIVPRAAPMAPVDSPRGESSWRADPMLPSEVPPIPSTPYLPLPAMPGASPMAPAPLDFGSAMAPLPVAGIPTAHVPAANIPMTGMPLPGIPLSDHPMAPVAMAPVAMAPVAMAIPLSHADAYLAAPPYAPSVPVPAPEPSPAHSSLQASSVSAANPAITRSSAAILAARHERSRSVGPILLGVGIGLVLLVIVGGIMHQNSAERAAELTADASASAGSTSASISTDPELQPGGVLPASQPPASTNDEPIKSQAAKKPPEMPADEAPQPAAQKPAAPEPAMPVVKPTETARTEPASKPATPLVPVTDAPAKMDDIPKPTPAELVKLGRAMQKAREAIGDHDFDKAAAFIAVASDMPRLPEHQAMLDRLKLLADSVKQYREAIQTSIDKLASGSSFEVGEQTVGVVETGPEKVIFRVAGQNRTYMVRDMPVGLAAALAAQTLAAEDPNTLTLKGAYVVASPRSKADDLKKAQEFLETASGSVKAAAELLRLFKDQYNFAAPVDK